MSNNCKSCGISIPEGQNYCSMCYGDPSYGKDGYYEDYLREQEEEQEEPVHGWDDLEIDPEAAIYIFCNIR